MFLETVGWITLTNNTGALLPGTSIDITFRAIPSTTTITNYALQSPLYGWNDNAGWINFGSVDGTYSGLTYIG